MRNFAKIMAAVVLASPFAVYAADMSSDSQIAEAVSPLPESMRDTAKVVNFDAKGNVVVLREGTGSVVCQPNQPKPTPDFSASCYSKALEPQRAMEAKLRAEGKDAKEVSAAVQAAKDAGKLMNPPVGTMMYSRSGKTADATRVTWVMLMPNMKAEDLGLPVKGGGGGPWMMNSGKPGAHIMMPQAAMTPKP
jgi:hypothetical protein